MATIISLLLFKYAIANRGIVSILPFSQLIQLAQDMKICQIGQWCFFSVSSEINKKKTKSAWKVTKNGR